MQTRTDPNLARLAAIQADIDGGRLHEAAVALTALGSATPNDPRIYVVGAMLAKAAGNPQQEVAALQRAVALAPGWLPFHLELAKSLSIAQRHEEALAAVNRAISLAPGDLAALDLAVGIANAAGDATQAQQHLRAARLADPGNVAILYTLAMTLSKQSQHTEAEPLWREALLQSPDDAVALGWLGTTLIGLNRHTEARTVLARAVALAPENPSLSFHLALARGETPPTQPASMLQEMFDDYAPRFDKHLVGELKYRVPKRVAELIRARPAGLQTSVLDLGCGTGLLGLYLGEIRGPFVGIDVSMNMLQQALRHDIYTDLRQAELLEELERTPAASFDVIVANDVFIYAGDLTAVIPAAFKALTSGGALMFSCETADDSEGDLVLRPSKRYAHSRGSVERLCREAGFARCTIEPVELRFDGGDVPVAGFIAVADKG